MGAAPGREQRHCGLLSRGGCAPRPPLLPRTQPAASARAGAEAPGLAPPSLPARESWSCPKAEAASPVIDLRVRSARNIRMRDKDARALEGRFEAFRAGRRDQQGGKDVRVALGR
eukprot:3204774-Pyramimonas_sp.AAC.1